MKTAVLLVTWLILHQQPMAYQVEYSTLSECLAARAALIKDAEGIGATTVETERNRAPGYTIGAPLYTLSAVCTERTK